MKGGLLAKTRGISGRRALSGGSESQQGTERNSDPIEQAHSEVLGCHAGNPIEQGNAAHGVG